MLLLFGFSLLSSLTVTLTGVAYPTYDYVAGHSGFLGRLLIPVFASRNHRSFHFLLVALPTVGIWFAALGVSTMAFGLNGFNFNHSILDSQGKVIRTNADLMNRAGLGLQGMHSPNVHNFPLVLSTNRVAPIG